MLPSSPLNFTVIPVEYYRHPGPKITVIPAQHLPSSRPNIYRHPGPRAGISNTGCLIQFKRFANEVIHPRYHARGSPLTACGDDESGTGFNIIVIQPIHVTPSWPTIYRHPGPTFTVIPAQKLSSSRPPSRDLQNRLSYPRDRATDDAEEVLSPDMPGNIYCGVISLYGRFDE